MSIFWKRINLQLFGGEGAGAGAGDGGNSGEGSSTTGVTAAPDAGEARLRELGVPESALAKHRESRMRKAAYSGKAQPAAQTEKQDTAQQVSAAENNDKPDNEGSQTTEETGAATETPARLTWDQIMADPEYNAKMQETVQARVKKSRDAENTLSKLKPALEVLCSRHGLDMDNLDADALTKAITDDNVYYEDKAAEMGVSVETAKKIDQSEREAARRQVETQNAIEQQKIAEHFNSLQRQGEEMKKVFPNFDLMAELNNPVFARMTSPNGGVSVEDAYYAVHRKEIQSAAMQATAQKTAEQMSAAIRSNQSRPVENGTKVQAPSANTFDYAHASREQREELKRRIRSGEKITPGHEFG